MLPQLTIFLFPSNSPKQQSTLNSLIHMKQVNKEVYAAIAMALHEFKGNNVHDKESGIITIKPHFTEWHSHNLNMTPIP